jgi:hypothetical protein
MLTKRHQQVPIGGGPGRLVESACDEEKISHEMGYRVLFKKVFHLTIVLTSLSRGDKQHVRSIAM